MVCFVHPVGSELCEAHVAHLDPTAAKDRIESWAQSSASQRLVRQPKIRGATLDLMVASGQARNGLQVRMEVPAGRSSAAAIPRPAPGTLEHSELARSWREMNEWEANEGGGREQSRGRDEVRKMGRGGRMDVEVSNKQDGRRGFEVREGREQ